MKLRKAFSLVLILIGLCFLFVLFAPTVADVNNHYGSGSTATLILLNRTRDLVVFPVLFGLCMLWVGLFLEGKRPGKRHLQNRFIRISLRGVALLMSTAGLYWSVGFVRMNIFPPMPDYVGYYLWEHNVLLCLWWCVVSMLLLVSRNVPVSVS